MASFPSFRSTHIKKPRKYERIRSTEGKITQISLYLHLICNPRLHYAKQTAFALQSCCTNSRVMQTEDVLSFYLLFQSNIDISNVSHAHCCLHSSNIIICWSKSASLLWISLQLIHSSLIFMIYCYQVITVFSSLFHILINLFLSL